MRGMLRFLPPVVAFFAILIAAAALSLLIAPWQAALAAMAAEILNAALGADGFDAKGFLAAIDDPDYVALRRRVFAVQAGFIVLVFAALAVRARAVRKVRPALDLVTAGVAGVLAAKLLFQVPTFDWPALVLCCLGGGAAALMARRAG